MIEQLRIQPYELPLRCAWETAKGGFDRRRGWLVEVAAEGLKGFGDCAPLPAAGTETAEAAWEALLRARFQALGRTADDLMTTLEGELEATPVARFALECALADLASRRQGLALRHWLSAEALDQVPVNVMLGSLALVSATRLRAACEEGFKVLKIKVGRDAPAQEHTRLDELARALPPGVGLRLDANGAWGPEEAADMMEALAALPIESIEEPLRSPDPETLAALQAAVPFPLARDESVQRLGERLDLSALGVRRIVLKPAVIGGLGRTLTLATRAMAAGVEVAITSLVESAAGLWPTTQLAAATGSRIPHGLATAVWLTRDLGPAPRPQLGRIALPSAAGSGFLPSP